MEGELSKVPYLIGAMRQWAMDAGYTPHLMVEAEYPGVKLPLGNLSIENGLVLLNVHNRAVDRYEMVDEWDTFCNKIFGTDLSGRVAGGIGDFYYGAGNVG